MSSVVVYFHQILMRKTARNASWMLLGQSANFILQAGCFILLARLMGVTQYGVFAGAIALVNIVTPYSSLGSPVIFMRYVAADRSKAGVYWGNILLVTGVGSVLIACIYFYLGPALTNIHSPAIFAVLVLGNCFLDQIAFSGSRVFQTFEKLHYTALMSFLSILARLLTVTVVWITWHHTTALQWAIASLVPSCITAFISICLVKREIGSMSFAPKMARHHLREGLGFSFSGTATSIYNDFDKTILSHYGLNRENGFYTLAYRVIEIATAPIAAIDYALLPRFFQLSRNGMKDAFRLSLRSMRMASLLGIGIAGIVLLTSPIIPHLVGRDFSGVIVALRWLCWIPLFRGIHRLAGGALTGTGHQNLRNVGQFAVAGINIVLNLWWIPAFGWIGAAWSSVASDGLLALITVLLLWWVTFHHTYTSDVKKTAA